MYVSLVDGLIWDQEAAGSNPVIPTFYMRMWRNGRRQGLKIPCLYRRVGSSPTMRTIFIKETLKQKKGKTMKDTITNLFLRLWVYFFFACIVVVALCLLGIITKAIGILTLSWGTILIPGGIALLISIIDILIFVIIGNNS